MQQVGGRGAMFLEVFLLFDVLQIVAGCFSGVSWSAEFSRFWWGSDEVVLFEVLVVLEVADGFLHWF